MKIQVPTNIRSRMKRELRRAGNREIGGVLMAEQIEPGSFRLLDFTVDADSGQPTHFVRDPAVHSAAMDRFFKRHGFDFARFNYLGEWHSHPRFAVLPSKEDVESMKRVIGRADGIEFAVLMIVRLRWLMLLEMSATLFVRGQGPTPAELKI